MKRIVFIDARNATRSQIAEAWFNHLAKDCGQAQSCGAMPANRVDVRAIKVMREVGLEIHTRAPKPINQQLLANADLVVLMGRDVRPYAFQSTQIWDFRDLDGEPIEAVRDLRDQIRARVQKLIAEIRMEEFETITTPTAWREMMLCLAAV